jgi:hypothetical protein
VQGQSDEKYGIARELNVVRLSVSEKTPTILI